MKFFKYSLILIVFSDFLFSEDVVLNIGADKINLPSGWLISREKNIAAALEKDGRLIAQLMVVHLGKSIVEESDEMAKITPKKAKVVTVVIHDNFKTFKNEEGARVFVNLAAVDPRMDGQLALYSWYLPDVSGCYTVKLKCGQIDAEQLAKNVNDLLSASK